MSQIVQSSLDLQRVQNTLQQAEERERQLQQRLASMPAETHVHHPQHPLPQYQQYQQQQPPPQPQYAPERYYQQPPLHQQHPPQPPPQRQQPPPLPPLPQQSAKPALPRGLTTLVSDADRKKQWDQKLQDMRRQRCIDLVVQWVSMIVCVLVYFGVGAAVLFHFEDGWSIIDCVYFCMVTMSTVGYGDFSPSRDESKIFTVVWIFFGVIVVFSQLGACLGQLTTPVTRAGRDVLERAFPVNKIDIDGDGTADFAYPRYFIIGYTKGMFPSLLLNIGLQLGSAAIFVSIEGWSYGNAVYHCLVTATTVGYGDMSIETEEGRLWATFHILFSVVLLAEAISSLGELAEERRVAFQRLDQLKRQMDAQMLDGLLLDAAELRVDDDDDPRETVMDVNESEFVVCMMLQMGVAKMAQVRPLVKKFRALDLDGSGRLGREDLAQALEKDLAKDSVRKGDTPRTKTVPYENPYPQKPMMPQPVLQPQYHQPIEPPPEYPSEYYRAPMPGPPVAAAPPEYYHAPPGYYAPRGAPPGYARGPSGIGAAFDAVDSNHDGKIDQAEFIRFNVQVPTPTRGGDAMQQPAYVQAHHQHHATDHRHPPSLPPGPGGYDPRQPQHQHQPHQHQQPPYQQRLPPVRPPHGRMPPQQSGYRSA